MNPLERESGVIGRGTAPTAFLCLLKPPVAPFSLELESIR